MRYLCALLLISAVAFGQTAAAPAFEVADVHASAPGAEESGGFLPGGQLELHGMTVLRLITTAYGLDAEHVIGGGAKIDSDKFDIIAKAPAGSGKESLLAMLQTLLADRFGLVLHKEDREFPVYKLLPGKRNPQLKQAAKADGPSECKSQNDSGLRTYTCTGITMANLAERLRMVSSGYFNHPVFDETGLAGAYDFTLKWIGRGQVNGPNDPNSLFVYLEHELGIKVAPDTRPMPVIVIDKVNQTPTPNAPGISSLLPPPPNEFEVAEIHAAKPGTAKAGDIEFNGGRFEGFGISLKTLLSIAYGVDEDRVMGEKWLETDKFDIVAKTPPTASFEAVGAMLKKFLIERFQLVAHNDNQPLPVFAIALAKGGPMLKEADGSTRPNCKMNVADGLRTYTCQNTTMAQLAEKLRPVAAGYLDKPLVDLTGLKGAYDFAIAWSPTGRVYGNGRGGGDSTAAAASEPQGGLTVFEGARKMGLELTAQKHPLPVLIVDKANRVPTGQ